jgi:uncharacterized protein
MPPGLHAAAAAAASAERAIGRLAPRSLAAAQASSLTVTAHRPWPVPDGPWIQGQTWCDLLFAHWPVAPEVLRAAVPAELPIDTFDGRAWIGVTPFEVRGARARGTPPVPGPSRFPETNVRTYTTVGGRPGIWFLSLDAASALVVAGARRTFRLPYFRARMAIERRGDGVDYRLRRADPEVSLALRYAPRGPEVNPIPGSLEHFLCERYCLYTLDERHRLRTADIHHRPWALHDATAVVRHNTMTAPYGIDLPAAPALLHFARRQDVVIWALRPVG